MMAAVLTQCVVGFVHPIAILNLLRYVETNGENAVIRPWYVIPFLLFLQPRLFANRHSLGLLTNFSLAGSGFLLYF